VGTIDDWQAFYLMAGDAVAALTGLLFAAASLHLREILARPDITQRIAVTLAGLGADLLFCGFMLVPGLTLAGVGIGLAANGLIFAVLLAWRRRGQRLSWSPVAVGLIDVSRGALLAGWSGALYVLAALIGLQTAGLIWLSWRLLTMAVAR
jgi:hypothetical protein